MSNIKLRKMGQQLKRLIAVLSGLSVGIVLWILLLKPSNPPPTWRRITPGQTQIGEVHGLLGEADEIKRRGNYIVYIFDRLPDLEWEHAEIFVKSGEGIVRAILLEGRSWTTISSTEQSLVLKDMILAYGKPDAVLWSESRLWRCLIWSRYGITATASAWTSEFDWNNNPIGSVVYFEPIQKWRILFSEDWGKCSFWNWYYDPPEGPRDRFPRDPYDWEHMPTPFP